jgi:hypothetical protein
MQKMQASYFDASDLCCGGSFTVGAEWIYFRPSVDSPYFVLDPSLLTINGTVPIGITVLSGERIANDFNYHSGYRVFGQVDFENCTFFNGRWTSLNTTATETVKGSNLLPILGPVNFLINLILTLADANSNFNYQSFEGVFGQTFFNRNYLQLTAKAGIEYARTQLDNQYRYVILTGVVLPIVLPAGTSILALRDQAEFWGVGPELGLDFSYMLPCHFSIKGYGTGSLLVSKMESQSSANALDGSGLPLTLGIYNITSENIWRVVPAVDFRIGLNYGFSLCSCCFDIEVGYEALAYINALPEPRAVESLSAGLSADVYSNVTMYGPYIAASVTF